jgi:hypothetical protein
VAKDPPNSRSNLPALRSRTAAQIVVGIGGAVCIGLGLWISWRARSSTPVLILGGVLVVVAYVGDRWEHFRVTRGDTAFDVWARGRASVQATEELTELTGNLADLKSKVDQDNVKGDLSDLQRHIAEALSRAVAFLPQPPPPWRAVKASHTIDGEIVQFNVDVLGATEDIFPLELEVRRSDSPIPQTIITDPTGIRRGDSFHMLRWRRSNPGSYRAVWTARGVPIVQEEFELS